MNNPDFMRTMMEQNPQMRQILDSNPELRHALQDPELMRRSMEMMRDPSAMQNMMRNQDLAMSQIENMPGGYNALRRMYEDVQEPMMDAMTGGGGGSGGTSNSNNNRATNRNGTAGATNQAMPNPWGPPASSPSSSGATATGGSTSANPFASLMGGFPMAGSGAGGFGASNPWTNPMVGNNAGNLNASLQMLENPMINQMMQNVLNNPEQLRMMMDANPMMRQLRETNPQMAAMMDNPETMRAMLDPNNIRAIAQMEQAMNQLSGSFPGIGLGGSIPPLPNSSGISAPSQGGLDFSSLLGTSRGAGAGGVSNPLFPFMMSPTGGVGTGQPSSQPAPGQRFRVQLQNLQDMGFTDRSSNIQALTRSHGNVNRAIEILLENPPEMGGSDSTGENNADAAESNQAADAAAANESAEGDTEPKGLPEKKND